VQTAWLGLGLGLGWNLVLSINGARRQSCDLIVQAHMGGVTLWEGQRS